MKPPNKCQSCSRIQQERLGTMVHRCLSITLLFLKLFELPELVETPKLSNLPSEPVFITLWRRLIAVLIWNTQMASDRICAREAQVNKRNYVTGPRC